MAYAVVVVVQIVALVHVVNVELACNQLATQIATREIDFITTFQLILKQAMFDPEITTQERVNASFPSEKCLER